MSGLSTAQQRSPIHLPEVHPCCRGCVCRSQLEAVHLCRLQKSRACILRCGSATSESMSKLIEILVAARLRASIATSDRRTASALLVRLRTGLTATESKLIQPSVCAVEVAVHNKGIVIPASVTPKLFDAFFQRGAEGKADDSRSNSLGPASTHVKKITKNIKAIYATIEFRHHKLTSI